MISRRLWRLRFFGGIVLFCTNKSFEGGWLADRRKATLSEGSVKRVFIIVIHYVDEISSLRGSVTVRVAVSVSYFVIHCVIHSFVIHLAEVCILHFGAPGIVV